MYVSDDAEWVAEFLCAAIDNHGMTGHTKIEPSTRFHDLFLDSAFILELTIDLEEMLDTVIPTRLFLGDNEGLTIADVAASLTECARRDGARNSD